MDRRHSSTIIPDIYQATINPDHWDRLLEKITKIIRSKIAYLYYLDKIKGTASTFAQFGSSTHLRQNYNKQFEKLDRLFASDLSGDDKGECFWQFFSPGVYSQSDIASEIYESWMKPEGIYYLGRIAFSIDDARKAAIVVLRDEEAGVWREGEISW